MNEKVDKKTQIIVLAAAGVLLLAALILGGTLTGAHPYEKAAESLRALGYTLKADDFYVAGTFGETDIASVLSGVNLQQAVEASQDAGFPGDPYAQGEITLLLLALEDGRVVTLFLCNGDVELGFIQKLNTGEVESLK